MTNLRYALVFISFFVLFLIINIPAQQIHNLMPQDSKMHFEGLSGGLWSGSAVKVQVEDFSAQKVDWSFNPLSLLMASISFDITTHDPQVNGVATINQSFFGSTSITDIDMNVTLQKILQPILQKRRLQAQVLGQAEFDMSEVEFSNGQLSYIDGIIILNNIQVSSPVLLPLGTLRVSVANNENGIIADIKDDGTGPVKLDAQTQLLPSGQYSLIGKIGVNGQKPKLAATLRILGAPDASGLHKLNYTGRI